MSVMVIAGLGCSSDGPLMEPGNDCMSCHTHASGGSHAWTAAGTVFPTGASSTDQGLSGVSVLITDATGKMISLESNSAGNFFTSEPLELPFQKVEVDYNGQTTVMPTMPTSGACNSCHTPGGTAGLRVYAP